LRLEITKRTDPRLLACMEVHYSQPKGFVGRNICYAVVHEDTYYGHIVGGSATLHLPGRNDYFSISKSQLDNIVNNIFFHVERVGGKYPYRNFVQSVIAEWRRRISHDWLEKYEDAVLGFETLVELPRTGECYLRDGWEVVGRTKGFTCKRVTGQSTDSWSGRRVWNCKDLRSKLVLVRRNIEYAIPKSRQLAYLGG
jgi:hypothetical protein